MRVHMMVLAGICSASIAGCQTPYTPEVHAEDDAKCRSVGHVPGTAGYNDCMAMNYAIRDHRTAQRNQAVAALALGALAVTAVAVAANNPPKPRYWCEPFFPYRCFYY